MSVQRTEAAHYFAEVETVFKCLSNPIALPFYEGVLCHSTRESLSVQESFGFEQVFN